MSSAISQMNSGTFEVVLVPEITLIQFKATIAAAGEAGSSAEAAGQSAQDATDAKIAAEQSAADANADRVEVEQINNALPARVESELDSQVPPTVAEQVTLQVDPKVAQAQSAADAAQGSFNTFANLIAGQKTAGIRLGDPSGWLVKRNSLRYAWDAAGNAVVAQPNALQSGYSRTGVFMGVMISPRRINGNPNPRMAGVGTGTFSSTFPSPPVPSSWSRPSRNSGTQTEFSPISAFGMEGVRMRLTASGGIPLVAATADAYEFSARTFTPMLPGEIWQANFFYRLVAGSMPASTTFRSRMVTQTAGGVNVDAPTKILTLDSTLRSADQTLTVGADAATGNNGLHFAWAIGANPDVTIDAFWTGLSKSPQVVPLPPLPAPVVPFVTTQERDDITAAAGTLGLNLSQTQGTLTATILTWGPFVSADPADWLGIVSYSDASAQNVIGLLINPAGTQIEGRLVRGGVVIASALLTIPTLAAATPLNVAMGWDGTKLQVAAGNLLSTQAAISGGLIPITQGHVGSFGPTLSFHGGIRAVDGQPTGTFAAALQQLAP